MVSRAGPRRASEPQLTSNTSLAVSHAGVDSGAIVIRGTSTTYSYKYPSRMDITLSNGGRLDCENLRSGCSG